MGGYRQQRGTVRRMIAGVVLGVVGAATVSAGAWAAAPNVSEASAAVMQQTVAGAGEILPAVAPFRATKFGMWAMGTVTDAAWIDFVGDSRAVIYPGYYPDGAVVGPDKTPMPEVDMAPSGEGRIWYSYDAPWGYQAFTQVIDGVAAGSFGLYMAYGNTLLDNFTVSVSDVSPSVGGMSTVVLNGDMPEWPSGGIEIFADGEVIVSTPMHPDLEKKWVLDVPNVPAGEHNWQVRLVSEGRIIMVRNLTVIAGALETPLAHPVAVAIMGGGVATGLIFAARQRRALVRCG